MKRAGIAPHLVWLLPLAVALLGLGGPPLFDVDEGAFSEATREMLASGDFLSTTLNGLPRYDKPILIYWLQAASVALLGVNELALRLPSALAGAAWCALLGRFAWQRFGAESGILAAVMTATSLGVFVIARAATADALLNLLIAAALVDGWRAIESGRRAPRLRTWLWIALGVLTKGPIALLVPAAGSFLYLASRRQLSAWSRLAFDPLGWLILIAVAGPWYAASLQLHGSEFIDGFVLKHNVRRFTGVVSGHSGGFAYYLVAVPVLLLPWSGLLVPALAGIRADWREPLPRFLWLTAAFVFLFFSFSGTKLPHYVLYGWTPLVLLLVRRVDRLSAATAWVPMWLYLAALAAMPAGLSWAARGGLIHNDFYTGLLMPATQLAGPLYPWLWLAPALLLLWLMRRPVLPLERRAAAAALGLGSFVALWFVPYLGELLQGPVKRAGLLARARPEDAVLWNYNAPSFSLYASRATPMRAPRPGELALTLDGRLPQSFDGELLFRERGVTLVKER